MSPIQVFKCLADETRLRIILLLQQETELCVCELTESLEEIQPKISRHLAQLRKCSLLSDRRQGQWVFYRLNPALPDWIKEVIAVSADHNEIFLQQNLSKLHKMRGRPERNPICC